jgi:ABC-type transport system involved in multi-copper enzyme maturation permease subunit
MLVTLFYKEVREFLMTFRFGAALVTTFVLIVLSVIVLGDDYLLRRDEYNRLADLYARDAANVYVPSMISPQLHCPPSPLSIFAEGETKHLGNTVNISRWQVPAQAEGSLTDNMLLKAYPSFDLMTVFTLVVSVFGILFSYDSLSGERERGILKQIFSNPVSRGVVYAAKFAAALAVLSIPVILSFLAALLIISFYHGIGLTAPMWLALALMLLAGLLYGALFIAIGMACSALVRRSSVALVLSLFLLAALVLFIPSVANGLSGYFVPLRPRSEVDAFIEKSLGEVREEVERRLAEEMQKLGFSHGSYSMMGRTSGESLYLFDGNPAAFERHVQRVIISEPLFEKRADDIWNLEKSHWQAKTREAEFSSLLSFISPAAHLRQAFTALAGTDFQTYGRFMDAARQYRAEMLRSFNAKGYFDRNALEFITRRTRDEITEEKCRERGVEYYNKYVRGENPMNWEDLWDPLPTSIVPAFRFEIEPDYGEAAQPMVALALAVIAIFACGFVAFLRMDVR